LRRNTKSVSLTQVARFVSIGKEEKIGKEIALGGN
jgi:hypothetical protein